MTEKEKVLHEATSRIIENLSAYGFLFQLKGKSIVKYSVDQDMRLEIFFQVNRRSSVKNLEVFPHVDISSKTLKEWQENEGIPNPTGVIFHSYLGYISPRKPKYEWVISGFSQDNAVKEITEAITKYACQLFEELSDTKNAVNKIAENVLNINDNIDSFVFMPPMEFVLCFGTKEKAQQLFDTLKKQKQWKGIIYQGYKKLNEIQPKTIDEIISVGYNWVGLSYLKGLKNEE